jgi:hypothetical protein
MFSVLSGFFWPVHPRWLASSDETVAMVIFDFQGNG